MRKILALLFILFAVSGAFAEPQPGLPAFQYSGDDPYTAAICEWLIDNEAGKYAPGDVAIPCPVIIHVDDSNAGDILVWGSFGIGWYELRNTTLFSVSGGSTPGLMHLQNENGVCKVVSADMVRDGSYYSEDIDRIFGISQIALELSELNSDAVRLLFVSAYAKDSGLNITQIQDFGWPPVQLTDAPETAEEDQIIHHESALGYTIDYDLRLFSFMSFGDNSECLSGVGDLEGISIDIERSAMTIDEMIASLKENMQQPVAENTVIGTEDTEVMLVYDAALAEGVHDRWYLIAAADGCIAINTCNIRYSFYDEPAVPGADEALEKTLATVAFDQ